MKTGLLHVSFFMIAGLVNACAVTGVPAVLQLARLSDKDARQGPAPAWASRELSAAEQVLGSANQEFVKNGDTAVCRDLAYIAENKLELATAVAAAELDRVTTQDAHRSVGSSKGSSGGKLPGPPESGL